MPTGEAETIMMNRRGGWAYGAVLLVGLVAGVVLLSALRFLAQPPETAIHHHATWAVMIDGERLDLSANRYMEDVFQCSADPTQQQPEDRVHMHENNQDVVHVHDSGVTWGHLLANLGFGIGDDYLETEEARYSTTDDQTLKFVVNGMPVRSIRNLPIRSLDRLLISYGPESVDEVVATQFSRVASDAADYNEMPDPASCSGQQELGFAEKLRRAVWF